MNQDERLDAMIDQVRRAEVLTEIAIPPELARPSSFLKVVNARHYNWGSEHFRKLFGMRFSVKIPKLEQLNAIFYPRQEYALPIFIFFLMPTKRKVIAHLNVCCPFSDAEYQQKWVSPLVVKLNKYETFEAADRYPEWMKKYRNESTIYGMFPIDRVEDLSNCCFDYLEHYVEMVSREAPETDPDRLQRIADFHAEWVEDIRTQDKAQGMIAKMIGKKTARRIFYEVTT
jgi:hypothetical protein